MEATLLRHCWIADAISGRSSTTTRSIAGAEFAKFLAVFAFAYGLNFLALLVLIHGLEIHPGLSHVLSGAVYVAVSYLMNKYFVFKIVAH